MTTGDLTQLLTARAEEKFGEERANELRPEIELMAADLLKLSAATAATAVTPGIDYEP